MVRSSRTAAVPYAAPCLRARAADRPNAEVRTKRGNQFPERAPDQLALLPPDFALMLRVEVDSWRLNARPENLPAAAAQYGVQGRVGPKWYPQEPRQRDQHSGGDRLHAGLNILGTDAWQSRRYPRIRNDSQRLGWSSGSGGRRPRQSGALVLHHRRRRRLDKQGQRLRDVVQRMRKSYANMEQRMFMEVERHHVEAFGTPAHTIKCLQIANGAAYSGESNQEWKDPHDAMLAALESIIEEAVSAPILVAYHFTIRQKQAGHDRPVFMHNIIARGPIDKEFIERVATKPEVQDTLMAAMKRRFKS